MSAASALNEKKKKKKKKKQEILHATDIWFPQPFPKLFLHEIIISVFFMRYWPKILQKKKKKKKKDFLNSGETLTVMPSD